ncbi:MAG: Na+/H+ antiporter subunit E [Desulfobacterales bacterium]|nr:Na+/H+ antiporter subunit E [Desulfobacterales bacterium]
MSANTKPDNPNNPIDYQAYSPFKPFEPPTPPERSPLPYFFTFCVCMITWLVLSGKFDLFHISLGVVSSAIVTYTSGDMLLRARRLKGLPGNWLRFIAYVPWLLFEIFRANMHVMRLVFHPRMMDLIDPRMFRFQSRLEDETARFIFANSITLTPGTITVYVSIFGKYTVHAIDKASGQGLPGEMEDRVGAIFGE